MSYQTITLDLAQHVATVTLNRPDKMNALNDQLLIDLQAAFDRLEGEAAIRAVILTGAGRAFCAGFDISPREKPFQTVQDWRAHVKLGNDLCYRIWRSRLPVIAAVNGHCLGGGCDLAAVCDFTIAAASAQFGEPEIQFHSAPPFMVLPWVLGMKQAKAMLLTGDRVDAEEAVRIGLATKVVPDGRLLDEATQLAQKLAKISPEAMELNKTAINKGFDIRGFGAAIELGSEMFVLVHKSESPESKEFFAIAAAQGLAAAFKWRDARFASH